MQEDRRVARSRILVDDGGIAGAVKFLGENETPQLLIVESMDTGDALFQALEGLANVCSPGAQVVLIGGVNDIALYKQLMDVGISEYCCGPVDAAQLIAVIERIFSDADSRNLGRVIAFIGARGGVGSSTLAANTAHLLGQQFQDSVVLVDLDLPFGTAALSLNLQPRQNIAEALADPNRLDDVLMERFMLKYDDHLSVVAAPAVLEGNANIDLVSFEILVKILQQMASFVVLDLPHQWPSWMPEVLFDANEVVATAGLDLACLRDVKNMFDNLAPKRGVDAPTRLVFNRVGAAKKTELSPSDFEEPAKVKPSAQIAFDPVLFGTALNNGEMLAEVNKSSRVVKELTNLANIVSARPSVSKISTKGGALTSFLRRTK